MKKVSFLRHNRLKAPYNNYDKLDFEELRRLGKGEVSPDIEEIDESASDKLFSMIGPDGIEYILHASSNRGRQTAEGVKRIIGSGAVLEENSLLNEIFFDPAKLVSEKEFEKDGVAAIRPIFYGAVADDLMEESFEKIGARIKELELKLRELPYERVLCISHGFFLVILQTYFEKGLTRENLKAITPGTFIDYLSGFTIDL